jgi:hypothetical protein
LDSGNITSALSPKQLGKNYAARVGVERAKFLKNDFFLQKKSFFKNLALSGRSFFP